MKGSSNYNNEFYLVCCNIQCLESGNIKKNINKCPICKIPPTRLDLSILNEFFCLNAIHCNDHKCQLLHSTKNHQSPPHISPCHEGLICANKKCLFLHPNDVGNSWGVR